jgi:hypothetical protein
MPASLRLVRVTSCDAGGTERSCDHAERRPPRISNLHGREAIAWTFLRKPPWHARCSRGRCPCGVRLPPRPLCAGTFFNDREAHAGPPRPCLRLRLPFGPLPVAPGRPRARTARVLTEGGRSPGVRGRTRSPRLLPTMPKSASGPCKIPAARPDAHWRGRTRSRAWGKRRMLLGEPLRSGLRPHGCRHPRWRKAAHPREPRARETVGHRAARERRPRERPAANAQSTASTTAPSRASRKAALRQRPHLRERACPPERHAPVRRAPSDTHEPS